jgi:hypothetical protein
VAGSVNAKTNTMTSNVLKINVSLLFMIPSLLCLGVDLKYG